MAEEWTTKRIDRYIIVNKKLGCGTYGIVYRGYLKDDETQQVAIKTIPAKLFLLEAISEQPKMLELIKREISILQKIDHPNIVKLIDVVRTSNYLYMVLELCQDGDLKDYMNKKEEKRLSELETVIFIKHIIEGFKQLYKSKIIHRDIKPANILLHKGIAKITDFGFARVIESEMNGFYYYLPNSFLILDPAYLSRLGSPLYMAPQILEGQPFSAKCDVWSLGILFYELLYGRTPWVADSAVNLLNSIKSSKLTFPSKPVRSQKVKSLIGSMLIINEKERIPWDHVFQDQTIRIDEEKIRSNLDELLKQKGRKLVKINNLYMR